MDKAAHTPGDIDAVYYGDGDILLESGTGTIAVVDCRRAGDPAANANRLALCWNAHDALVAALAGLVGAVVRDADEPGGRGISGFTAARLADARAALALCPGGPG